MNNKKINDINIENIDRIELVFENCEVLEFKNSEIVDFNLIFKNRFYHNGNEFALFLNKGYIKIKIDETIEDRIGLIFDYTKTNSINKNIKYRLFFNKKENNHDITWIDVYYKNNHNNIIKQGIAVESVFEKIYGPLYDDEYCYSGYSIIDKEGIITIYFGELCSNSKK